MGALFRSATIQIAVIGRTSPDISTDLVNSLSPILPLSPYLVPFTDESPAIDASTLK